MKSAQIGVRTTQENKKILEKMARESGCRNLSTYIESILVAKVKRYKKVNNC